MAHLIFVYGTLKEGFCNFHVNQGRRVDGDYVTVQAHALYIVGPRRLPWLVPQPGQGGPVVGQLFEVDDITLAELALETFFPADEATAGALRDLARTLR